MSESRTHIPVQCPRCGTFSDRGIRVGSLMSNVFRCEACGARILAKRYHFFSALYGLLAVLLTVAGLVVLQRIFGQGFRFEYVLSAVAIAVLLLMWAFSTRYWRLVLRWIEVA